MYTIQQLARLAGITTRTLRHYDAIGLLKPSSTGENGYRYYDTQVLLKLQQILLHRELGLPLEEIRAIIVNPGFQPVAALEQHRANLIKRIGNLEHLVVTVDDTILHLKGKKEMSDKQLFEPFNETQQAEYEKEAMRMYDPEVVRKSNRKWKNYTREEKQRIGEEGDAAYRAIVAAIPLGPASPEAQKGVELWRRHLDYFWTPEPEQLVGLAHLYNDDPRFKANFDRIDPRLAEFMLAAVGQYVKRLKKS